MKLSSFQISSEGNTLSFGPMKNTLFYVPACILMLVIVTSCAKEIDKRSYVSAERSSTFSAHALVGDTTLAAGDTIILKNGRLAIIPVQTIVQLIGNDSLPQKDSLPPPKDSLPPVVEPTPIRPIAGIGASTTVTAPASYTASYEYINLGRGGYTFGKAKAFYNWDSIATLNPIQYVLQLGDNDVYEKRSYSIIMSDAKWIIDKLMSMTPDASVLFVEAKATGPNQNIMFTVNGGTYNGWAITEWINNDLAKWALAKYGSRFQVAKTYSVMLLWNPKRFNTALYNADQVHFNSAGFQKYFNTILPLFDPRALKR